MKNDVNNQFKNTQGFSLQAFILSHDIYNNYCSACAVTIVIFGHFNRSFFTYLLTKKVHCRVFIPVSVGTRSAKICQTKVARFLWPMLYNIALNSSDNRLFYPPDKYHSSDDVYYR